MAGFSDYGSFEQWFYGQPEGHGRYGGDFYWAAKSLENDPNFTQKEKFDVFQKMIDTTKGAGTGWLQVPAGVAAAGEIGRNAMADKSRDLASRREFIKEQYNALDNATNSKLQQTKLTSFLGATAARAAL